MFLPEKERMYAMEELPEVADDTNVFELCAYRAMGLYSEEDLNIFYAAYGKNTGRKTSEDFQRRQQEHPRTLCNDDDDPFKLIGRRRKFVVPNVVLGRKD